MLIPLFVFLYLSQCEMKDVESEEMRISLFLELLESSAKWEEFQHLMLLLQAWPPMIDRSSTGSMCENICLSLFRTDQNPWLRLTSALLTHSSSFSQINIGNELLSMCRSLYSTKHKLNPQCIKSVCCQLLDAGLKLSALKLMTENEDEHLRKLTQDQIRNISESGLIDDPKVTEDVCDSELLSLLLNAEMLISCVDTALYSPLVSHMLAQGAWDVEKAARDLHQAGHSAQAGSLLLSHRGSHPGHFTFNSALAVIRKWL
ncbi:hypothetical protein DNTS_034478 [Danionella cerebrum]|uniref:Neuroblastoma-amplified sequence N-terminal domain-containing protein n=1 Tax=Danionella cerebrum TaxID=2873325 RepID=A0A553RJT5_9TELE|nr:hypothetical protein DNTS_034478 [Danionella translucida]